MEPKTPAQVLNAAINAMGLTSAGFASRVGTSGEIVRNWRQEIVRVPTEIEAYVRKVLEFHEANPPPQAKDWRPGQLKRGGRLKGSKTSYG